MVLVRAESPGFQASDFLGVHVPTRKLELKQRAAKTLNLRMKRTCLLHLHCVPVEQFQDVPQGERGYAIFPHQNLDSLHSHGQERPRISCSNALRAALLFPRERFRLRFWLLTFHGTTSGIDSCFNDRRNDFLE